MTNASAGRSGHALPSISDFYVKSLQLNGLDVALYELDAYHMNFALPWVMRSPIF